MSLTGAAWPQGILTRGPGARLCPHVFATVILSIMSVTQTDVKNLRHAPALPQPAADIDARVGRDYTPRLLKKWQYPDKGAELRPAPAFLDKAADRQGEAVEAEEEFG